MSQTVFGQYQFFGPTVRVPMKGAVMGLTDMGIPLTLNNAPIVGLHVTVETGGVRWAVGGTSPDYTANIGHLSPANDEFHVSSGSVRTFEVVDDAGETSAVLQITPEYEVTAS